MMSSRILMFGGDVMNSSSVSQNVKRIIKDKGMLQYAVADRAGYSRGAFNAMLNGRKTISDVDIIRLATVLDVSPNDLFGFSEKSAAS